MADEADVRYVIRADDSRLEADLAHAENTVRQSAQRSEAAANSIGESAERANERVSESTRRAAEETRKTGEETEKTQKKYKSYSEELDEVNRLLEKDGKNTTLLAQKKELLSKAIAETSEKLQKLKARHNEVEQAYKNGDIPDDEYRDFQREIVATEQELQGYQNELNNVGNASEETAEKTESKLGKALGTVGKAAAATAAAVGAAAVAVGTAAVKSADSLDKAVNRVISATGASEDAAKQYADVINGVYGDNFGESFDDIAVSISKITQNLGEMDEVTLQNVTERAYTLQDVFEMGVDESARAAKAMKENFGVSAEKAYDYIAKGAQDGLDYSGELLDSISEYSVQFAKLGFSADDMFNIFAQGAENGAWNLDKVGDAIKEFSIRAIDGSDTTKAGFQAIGYDAEDMAKKFAQGGDVARDAFKTVVSALTEMEDPIARDAAGVNLFGTMWEDLGVEAVAALGKISDSAYDCAGAMDSIMEVNYSSLSDAWGGLQRQVELLVQPLGDSLIPIVSEVIDELSEMADEVIPELLAAIQPVIENLTPLIEPLLGLVSSVLPQIIELVTPLIEMISELIQTVLPPLTEFLGETLIPIIVELVQWFEEAIFPIIERLIGWLTESLMPVLQKVLDELLPPIMAILEALTPVLQTVLDIMLPILDLILGLIAPILQLVNEAIAPLITELLGLINDILTPLMPLILAVADVLTDRLGNAINFVTDILGTSIEYVTNIVKNAREIFSGLIDFITGVFTGNWEKAWNGVAKIFDGVWNNIKSVAEYVVNGIIDLINSFISGINSLFGWLNVSIEPLKHVDWTADDAQQQAINAVDSYPNTSTSNSSVTGSSWYADYYRNGDNLTPEQKNIGVKKAETAKPSTSTSYSAGGTEYTYKPYVPTADTGSGKSTSGGSAGSSSGSKGNFVSITSYVPTMWDNDQTAALKSLIGKDVLGNTTSAHQINELTGAISTSAQNTAGASGETTLADVVNAITKLQRRVEGLSEDIGDVTIELKARDLTIGKAAVRDINDMAKQSGKSPFTF